MLTKRARLALMGMSLPISDNYSNTVKEKRFSEMVSKTYNMNKHFFSKKVSTDSVYEILFCRKSVQGINTEDVILIAKAFCKGASVVCPLVDKL